eukprot:CAMPEP_0184684600 /NCGR_PEP_ID=MMETSP0312-20130426/15905_1 /TAXON_ID=31354 /ORGANISM="Compsopogon coeruleus, Strain SAG 36.94" /LENGTH=79 /DNA_ID=CAMNT_0027137939 /DNA_START=127 /DNA_END=366 /DNA_ORIENTATION=-
MATAISFPKSTLRGRLPVKALYAARPGSNVSQFDTNGPYSRPLRQTFLHRPIRLIFEQTDLAIISGPRSNAGELNLQQI